MRTDDTCPRGSSSLLERKVEVAARTRKDGNNARIPNGKRKGSSLEYLAARKSLMVSFILGFFFFFLIFFISHVRTGGGRVEVRKLVKYGTAACSVGHEESS